MIEKLKALKILSLLLVLYLAACGEATVFSPDTVLADGSKYQGELKNGLMHGHGELHFSDGRVYQGQFKDGKFHGQGSLENIDKSVYVGDFKAGLYHGDGSLTLANESVYVGEFEKGTYSGKGKYTQGNAWYKGEFVDGTLTGKGSYSDQSGNTYSGEITAWLANGEGELSGADGSKVTGTFVNGYIDGKGEKTFSDGGRYYGDFKYSEYDGKGVLTHADKSVYDGEFSFGEYHGKGTLTEPQEDSDQVKVTRGKWRGGKLIYNEFTGEHLYDQSDLALERHQLLLNTQLLNLKESDPKSANVYFLGIAGDGTQSVFRRELEFIQGVIERRYQSKDRSVMLINHHDSAELYPMATKRSIDTAIKAIGTKMDAANDVLFIYLSSHGSKDHEFSLTHDSIRLPDLRADSLATMFEKANVKWRVIFVSACYSGGFIPSLENDSTIVITAADSENTSFGCSEDSEMTYFGKAFFKEVLSKDTSLSLLDAFDEAKKIIKKWENDEELDHSNPSISASKKIVRKLRKLSEQSINK